LLLASTVAAFVGVSLLTDPHHFYASYGLELATHPTLWSEFRATAAMLVSVALLLSVGVFVPRHRAHAALLGAVFYLSYAAGRAASVWADGLPHVNLLYAALAELALGVSCVWVYTRELRA
jgi:hypothetical protein